MVSNAGNLVSPSRLVQTIGVKSPTTILEYFSYFEAAYLVHLVPRFSWSPKAQALAPKKLYIADPGLIRIGSVSYTQNTGALLENFVYLQLRRTTDDIYYFSENNHECDFIINPHTPKPQCIQVCHELTLDNQTREIQGLLAALAHFSLSEGLIITADTTDQIYTHGKKILVNKGSDPLL